jgi:hypothetical protein
MSSEAPEVDLDEDDTATDTDAATSSKRGDDEEEEEADDQEQDDYGEPFDPRSFGGEFVWAKAKGYTCKILRVRAGEKVLVSTRGRQDMVVMLTGGRAVLEVLDGDETDRVEMMPAAPVRVHPEREHRLVAMTEVEMFTVYTVIESS